MFRFTIPRTPQATTEGTGGGTGNASTAGVKEGTGDANTLTKGTETTDHKAGGSKPGDAGTAGKTDEGKAAETASPKAEEKPAPKAPEKYDLTLPDAGKGLIADSDLKRFETIARQYELSNEDAQAMLDEQVTLVASQAKDFLALSKADKEIGGDNLPIVESLAQRAIDRIRPATHPRRAAFLAFLERGGANKHPEVLAFLADLGRAMGEDKPLAAKATSGATAERTVADVLYPNQAKG